MRRALPLACAGLVGCATTHSVPPPAVPAAGTLEVGPVVSRSGLDVGPMLADRLTERGLVSARHVPSPSGTAPYVEGELRVSGEDVGQGGNLWAGAFLLGPGVLLTSIFGALLVVSQTDDNYQGPGVGVSAGFGGAGVALTATAIVMWMQPSQYMEADVKADLRLRRGERVEPLQVEDHALVRHSRDREQDAAVELLDGVANGVAAALP